MGSSSRQICNGSFIEFVLVSVIQQIGRTLVMWTILFGIFGYSDCLKPAGIGQFQRIFDKIMELINKEMAVTLLVSIVLDQLSAHSILKVEEME